MFSVYWNAAKNECHVIVRRLTQFLRINRKNKVVCLYFAGETWKLATLDEKKQTYFFRSLR